MRSLQGLEVKLFSDGTIDVGSAIRDTQVKISDSGELMIKGRACIVDGQLSSDWVATGDLATRDANGGIHVIGRINHPIVSLF